MHENSDTDDLYLFFPQWEGAGQITLYAGATLLRAILKPPVPFTEIAVESTGEIAIEHDIIGYAALLLYAQQVQKLLSAKNPCRIFTLGGDCSVDLVPISFLNQLYDGDLAVIWLDAHPDANTPQSSPSKTFHGMALRALLGESTPEMLASAFSILHPEQVFLAGVRELDPPEQQFLAQAQIPTFSSTLLAAHPEALVEAIKMRGFNHIYLHIDVDVLDPVAFPAIKHLSHYPTPGGISIETLAHVQRTLINHFSPIGWSLVEVIPAHMEHTRELEQLAALYTQAFH